ncbi:MAG: HesA/MoeB/ThiF family protein [Spirochaetes bacterium]|jgi:adenylyltransferase/sulfurtransferase|nr:HesA/MoeB/ThiF family protein [Spirochaetota bacterium]
MKLYKKQLGINGWGKQIQDKIKETSVFIAGAGGLGSPVSLYLAAAGIGKLIICDNDRVEHSNLNRQILHGFNDIKRFKTDSASDRLKELNPYIEIKLYNEKITTNNSINLVSGADIIVDCLDNFHTRFIINEVSVKKRIPMVHAGVAEMNGQVTFICPPETACLECFMPKKSKRGFSIVGATAGIIGSIQAMEVIKYITGTGVNLKNRLLIFDGKNNRFESINLFRNPNCKICGKIDRRSQ